jgi:hypothetical protein
MMGRYEIALVPGDRGDQGVRAVVGCAIDEAPNLVRCATVVARPVVAVAIREGPGSAPKRWARPTQEKQVEVTCGVSRTMRYPA